MKEKTKTFLKASYHREIKKSIFTIDNRKVEFTHVYAIEEFQSIVPMDEFQI